MIRQVCIVLAALAALVASRPAAGAEIVCHVRPLSQGSGMVKICEVKAR